MSTTPAVANQSRAGRRTSVRSLLLWSVSFLAFPAAGLLGSYIVGPVDNLGAGLIGGALLGLVLGLAQSLLSSGRLPAVGWTVASTVGASVGVAAGSLAIGYRTTLADLAIGGLITGLLVGVAQAVALPKGTSFRWVWAPIITALWSLAWVITTLAGVKVGEQFIVFGSSGALVYTVLSGLALHLMLRRA